MIPSCYNVNRGQGEATLDALYRSTHGGKPEERMPPGSKIILEIPSLPVLELHRGVKLQITVPSGKVS